MYPPGVPHQTGEEKESKKTRGNKRGEEERTKEREERKHNRRKEKKEEMKRIREEGKEEEERGNEYLTSHMTDDDSTVWMPVPWLHDR